MVMEIEARQAGGKSLGAGEALGKAWRWWTGELAALFCRPIALRPAQLQPWPAASIQARSGSRVDLQLADGIALERDVAVPSRARSHLRPLLRHEISRQFPFTADDCAFTFEILEEAAASASMTVRLIALPNRDVTRIDQDLAALGVRRGRIAVAARHPSGKPLTLCAPSADKCFGMLDGLLIAGALAALTTMLALPYWQEAQALRRLSAALPAVSAPDERAATDLIDRQMLAVSEARLSGKPVSVLLDDLSRALPDDTWVRHLRIDAGHAEIDGTAADAAALVPALEAIKGVSAVAFAAPTVLDPVLGVERFRFRLSLDGAAL